MKKFLFAVFILLNIALNSGIAFAAESKTITYYENSPVAKGGGDGKRTATEVLTVGDRLAGNYPERLSETEQDPNVYGKYRNPGDIWGFLHGYGGMRDALLGRSVGRAYAWNTKPDGSGVWYSGGQTVTADMPDNLELYLQYSNLIKMLSWQSGSLNKAKPEVYLEGDNKYKDIKTAYEVDQSQSLRYKSILNFDTISSELVVLWGRIGRVDNSSGKITAKFDKRLKFLPEIDIVFTSTWIKPKVDVANGILSVDKDNSIDDSYRIKFDTTKMRMVGDELVADLSVEMISRIEFKDLTFQKFMQPMTLSIADDYSRGINAIITQESFNEIATSDNPIVKVGGSIKLDIQGDFIDGFYDSKLPIDKSADYQYARLFPTGSVEVEFEDAKTGESLKEQSNKLNDLDSSLGKRIFMGRSKHSSYGDTDPRNYADVYDVDIPNIPGYVFVGVKNNIPLSGEFDYKNKQNIKLLYSKSFSIEGFATWRGGRIMGSPKLRLKLQRRTLSEDDWKDVDNSEVLVGESNYYKWSNIAEFSASGEKYDYRLIETDGEKGYTLQYRSENGKLYVDHISEDNAVNKATAPNTGIIRENNSYGLILAVIAIAIISSYIFINKM